MITVVSYAGQEEQRLLRELLARLTIHYMEEDCELYCAATTSELEQLLSQRTSVDILFCDVVPPAAVSLLQRCRQQYPNTKLVPIADGSVLPASYVRPDIMPCALLWRPLSEPTNHAILDSLIRSCAQKPSSEDSSFVVRTKQQTFQVPYRDILYFEAKNKRLYLRTKHKELSFYDTLSNLEEELTKQGFIRCHKSYLANTAHILAVDRQNGLLHLTGEVVVPISRSCRSAVDALLK